MFKQKTKDTINGWGLVFRFITPLLISIALWIISDIKTEIRDIKSSAAKVSDATVLYNTNHLKHHEEIETRIFSSLARVETLIKFHIKDENVLQIDH